MNKIKTLLQYFFQPTPPVILAETDRLLVRNFTKDDIDDLYEFTSMAATSQYDFYEPYSRLEAERQLLEYLGQENHFSNGHFSFAVELKTIQKVIGNIGCEIFTTHLPNKQAKIGYTIHPYYQQRGFGYEACYALVEVLFTKEVHRICAHCFVENMASWKLLEKLGMRREAHHLKMQYTKDRFWDQFTYAILAEEWKAKSN